MARNFEEERGTQTEQQPKAKEPETIVITEQQLIINNLSAIYGQLKDLNEKIERLYPQRV